MELLRITQEMAALPVTDIKHVVGEINLDRMVKEDICQSRRRDALNADKYRKRRKHNKQK